MKRLVIGLISGLLVLMFSASHAANCSSYPYTLTNGSTADANQVMANFNNILNCANTNLAHNGANGDITSLSGISTPISTAQGGTGNTTGQPSGTAGGDLSGSYPNPALTSNIVPRVLAYGNVQTGSTAILTTGLSSFSGYKTIEVRFQSLSFSTTADIFGQFSTNGGSTWISTGYKNSPGSGTTSSLVLTSGGSFANGSITLYAMNAASPSPSSLSTMNWFDGSSTQSNEVEMGVLRGTSNVNAVQFYVSGGTVTGGTYTIVGYP